MMLIWPFTVYTTVTLTFKIFYRPVEDRLPSQKRNSSPTYCSAGAISVSANTCPQSGYPEP